MAVYRGRAIVKHNASYRDESVTGALPAAGCRSSFVTDHENLQSDPFRGHSTDTFFSLIIEPQTTRVCPFAHFSEIIHKLVHCAIWDVMKRAI